MIYKGTDYNFEIWKKDSSPFHSFKSIEAKTFKELENKIKKLVKKLK